MLFSFNDEFIAAMCGGLNDDDTLELFMSGYQAVASSLATGVRLTTGEDHEAELDLGAEMVMFELTEEEALAEFGDGETMMKPSFRQGVTSASQVAALAFSKVVNNRG